ncbi:MAG: 30S ribosomal protein S4 [Nitrosopumilus sp.]|nr:30S ribosomal protein S4 [Nitrosopumilus sp.]MDH3489342.1 30S ribosomal protein S4 [Nitrosopumilus sp.]MDH3516340.1 30S ribosomal protein S4 [Nitrosopumilus sp.]MDH3564105.1 30S ribosomal protein S4 [Nitrosopumilus sp.]MDH5418263.1 30S ribosomal protein S4 [Nitrosopumilus sp.]
MGDPKYPRKVWRKPKRPFNYELKMEELKTLGTFGLRTKRELWKAHTELSRVRHQARSLLALRQEVREEKEPILMKSLARIGLVSSDATLDDVLNLNANDLLSRRLQTLVTKKFGFKSPYQARQAVIHGHIMIGDRKVDIPSYTVTVEEEDSVHFTPESKIPEMLEKTKSKTPSPEPSSEETAEESKEQSSSAEQSKEQSSSAEQSKEQSSSAEQSK